MTPPEQLPLDLGHRIAVGREDFLVAPANEEAVAWIDRWPGWPSAGLGLTGPPGAGKTHLAAVWRARAGAALIEGHDLLPESVATILSGPPALVVESAEAAPEEALLHLHNGMAERRGFLLLTAPTAPARWGTRLPDLASRLAALPVASIEPPDDALIRAVLVKLFADRQLLVGADIVEFLALRMERSFEAARRLVAAIDAEALARRGRITLPLVRRVVERL